MREPVEELFPAYGRAAVRVLKPLVKAAAHAAFRVRVDGFDHLPRAGPAIVAANHVSLLDAPMIFLISGRRVTFLAKAEYWEQPFKRFWLGTLAGQIPVERGTDTAAAALDEGLRVLELGGLIGIHPEGTRSPDGRMYRPKTGVARLAAASGAPVVPVGVVGTLEVLPKGRSVPRFGRTITFTFGEPLRFPPGADATDPDVLHAFADDVMARIATMTGQQRCDEYNDASSRPPTRVKTRRGRQMGS
jgi:1-acyl-sn-glycerol-3-phosphate acyltransferase